MPNVLQRRRRQPKGGSAEREEHLAKGNLTEPIVVSTTKEPSLADGQSETAEQGDQFTMIQKGDKMIGTLAAKSGLPFLAVLLIILVIVAVMLVVFYCFLQKWWRKFRESDKGKNFKGLDLKSVNLIGQMGKEKVRSNGGFHWFSLG